MLRNGILYIARTLSSARPPNQRIRTKLFVGGLSYDTNETALRDAFAPYGEILEVNVIVDRRRYRSLGYGFIRFSKEAEAESALNHMQGQFLDGRVIRLEYARCVQQSDELKSQETATITD